MITWQDLKAWADLTRETVDPWEARLILRLSRLQATIAMENTAGARGKAGG